MYEKKKKEDLTCGIEVAAKVFFGKWKCCIIDSINKGNRRPSEIHRSIPSATPRVLNLQMKELETFNVVRKRIYPGLPPKVEYDLTETGKSILPIISIIEKWGQNQSADVIRITEMQKILRSTSVQ